jgi:hypothetical protein
MQPGQDPKDGPGPSLAPAEEEGWSRVAWNPARLRKHWPYLTNQQVNRTHDYSFVLQLINNTGCTAGICGGRLSVYSPSVDAPWCR